MGALRLPIDTEYVGKTWEAMVRLAGREQIGFGEYDRRWPYPEVPGVRGPELRRPVVSPVPVTRVALRSANPRRPTARTMVGFDPALCDATNGVDDRNGKGWWW